MLANTKWVLAIWPRVGIHWLVVLWLLACACPGWTAEPLRLPGGLDGKPIGLHLDLLRDPEGRLGIDDVSQGIAAGRFAPSAWDSPNLGYTEDAVWARLPIHNESSEAVSFLLEVAYPQIDRVELYTRQKERWVQRVLGDCQPFGQGSRFPCSSRSRRGMCGYPSRTRGPALRKTTWRSCSAVSRS